MEIREVLMTPADAAKLLEMNTRNRKLIRSRVTALTAAIERGEWVPDGNPIKISVNDVVLDGQHRLASIAGAEAPVKTWLATGLSDESQLVMDSGKPRTFGDYLHIKGIPNSLNAAATTRLLWSWDNGLFGAWSKDWFARPVPTNAQLWETFDKRHEDIELALKVSAPVLRVVRASRAVLSGGWIILGDVECGECSPVGPDLDEFYDQLAMRKVSEFDSITLFIRLLNGKDRDRKSALTSGYAQHVQLALLIKAWNAYRTGRPVATLRFSLGGKNRERFPLPH